MAFVVLGGTFAAAQEVPQLTVGRLADGERPEIDGRVDEDVWSPAEPFSTFTQQEPNEGEPATERTEIRFLIDRGTLYIGVVCFDSSPTTIVVSQSRRDADLDDTDSIQILLDTFNDGQNAFVFGTNPFGIEYDGQVMAEGQTAGYLAVRQRRIAARPVRASTRTGMPTGPCAPASPNAAGKRSSPFRSRRCGTARGTDRTWGVNVMRNIRRKNEQVFLAPVPRGYTLHRVSVAGKLNGLSLPARRDLKFMPYVSGVGQRRHDAADRHRSTDRATSGLDVKWGVRADLTLDVTVNTDFAQVEADEQQVNLTRFPLFFPEKRPFFLENAQTFQLGQPQADRSVLLAPHRPVAERRSRSTSWRADG